MRCEQTYNKAVSEALGWIANQTETASSADIGNDQEQCEALLETFNVFKVLWVWLCVAIAQRGNDKFKI